jgi:hypothetical protein
MIDLRSRAREALLALIAGLGALGICRLVAPVAAWVGDCGPSPCPIGTLPTLEPPGDLNISRFDPYNDTYLKFWFNLTKAKADPVHFDWYGLIRGLATPFTITLGAWVFMIIWFLYLFMLYERTQDVTPVLVIGILSAAVMGSFFPQEAILPALIIFAACMAAIAIRVMKEKL